MAATPLRRLLDDEDPRVRIAAYEELTARRDLAVQSRPVGVDNFLLELAPSSQRPMIYAKRTGQRRIVIIGGKLRCATPLFYISPDGALTINAHSENDTELTVVRKSPISGFASPPIPCSRDVIELVQLIGGEPQEWGGVVKGLGVDYGALVHVLYTLCHSGAINADFILEEENAAERFGPPTPRQRPESEL